MNPMTSKTKTSRAEQYIEQVVSGEVVTSKLVRLACERHRKDLVEGHLRNLKFDQKQAQHIIQFVQTFCHHSQGEWAGQRVKLEPWQQAMLHILYGWRWADTGYRRFKFAYVELAKGNGKSFLASAIGLYELIASGEPGSEVYSVATKKDQARIVFSEAERMVKASPSLKSRIKSFRDNLHIAGTASKFQPLSSDEDSLDGPRPQAIIVDELHAWGPSGRKLWDVLANALGKRRSPIFLVITTAGSGEESLCRQQHNYCDKVLSSVHQDDSWFAWVCGLDDGDDHLDEANWIKANPNLGVSVNIKELREVVNKAKGDPASLNGVLRLRLGVWTSSTSAWIDIEEWNKNVDETVTPDSLKGQPCFGGLDLSTTTDISAFVLLFPPYGDRTKWAILPFFFLPADNIEKRAKRDRVPYDVWQRQGLFHLTSGNVIDYDAIRAKIAQLAEEYDLREVAADPWNATETLTKLQEAGFVCSTVRQGFASMAGPTKRLGELILKHDLVHFANPILRWMASNVVVDMDATGSIKPDKAKSTEKVDGIVALICALSRAMVVPVETTTWAFMPVFL
jgi:phage terminase large subunit-like protein